MIRWHQKEGPMRILLATDGSEYSEGSAKLLTRFRLTPADEIIVLHVISEIPFEDDYKAQIRKVIRKVAPKILSDATDILKPVRAKVAVLEEEGYPSAAIIEAAVKSGCDLIVMGARGVRGVKLLFLGSTTRAVAIDSTIPVLVTHAPLKEPVGRTKVLYATDGSAAANAAGTVLASLPLPEDAEVSIIHVTKSVVPDIPWKYLGEMDIPLRDEVTKTETLQATQAEKVTRDAAASLSGRFAAVRGIIASGDPSSEILREAEALDVDIIALGSRGLKGVRGMLGSVSRRVLGRAACAVLIGK
jgi:nucleotide-binding universal stress UspA family protein